MTLCVATSAQAATSVTPQAKFVAHAESYCQHANIAIHALPPFPFQNFDALHPDPKMLREVGKFFNGPGNEVPIARRLMRRLRSLGTPPSRKQAWVQVLATLQKFISVIRQEAITATNADVDGWVKAVDANRLLPSRLTAATKRFGAKRCAIFS